MFVFRAIHKNDLKELTDLAFTAHAGITSLPKNKKLLSAKLEHSLNDFQKELFAPEHEHYLFVLENFNNKTIGGVSGIDSKSGVKSPSYYYRIVDEPISDTKLKAHAPLPQQTLNLVSYSKGPTENVSLFIHPNYRKEGLGKLLSLSRFLFIASHRQRFEDIIIASLRGIILHETCPFWEGFGRAFFNVDYTTIEEIRQQNPEFLVHILPRHPIYISLLSEEVRNSIGMPHQNSAPALKMLREIGFKDTHEIDPFDGGPKISAHIDQISLVSHSKIGRIEKLEKGHKPTFETIACNNRLDFRAAFVDVKHLHHGSVTISEMAADALKVGIGDQIRYANVSRIKS